MTSVKFYSNRGGATFFLVIMMGMILMALAVILMQDTGVSKERVFERKEKLQCTYMAKGGQQHALLKIRLLPTPFYDAVAYAIGKNPYFDFSEPITLDPYSNPGPLFLTGDVDGDVSTDPTRPHVKIINNLRNRQNWALDSVNDPLFTGTMATHLQAFLEDICTDYHSQVIVSSAGDNHMDYAMGQGWRDPFDGEYTIRKVFIFGSKGRMNYATDSIMISTEGTVMRDNQISIIPDTASGGNPRNLTRVYLRHSTTQAGSGFQDQVDEELSNADKFADMENYETSLASAKRAELVTGIYEVRRKN
jgi:hypothetical protein